MYKTTEFNLAEMYDWEMISKGGQGEVWRATKEWLFSWGPSAESFAIKFFNNPLDYYNEHFMTAFLGDRDVTVQKIGTGFENTTYFIVYELADYSLLDWLNFHNTWTEHDVLVIIAQLLKCLKIIHERCTLHLDIKPSNIFISHKRIKFGDFGCATQFFGSPVELSKFHGTRGYQAPESHATGLYRPSSDFYSLGRTIMEFVKYPNDEDYRYEWFFPTKGSIGTRASDEFIDFTTGLLDHNVVSRYGTDFGVDELLSHRVFDKINLDHIDRFDIV